MDMDTLFEAVGLVVMLVPVVAIPGWALVERHREPVVIDLTESAALPNKETECTSD